MGMVSARKMRGGLELETDVSFFALHVLWNQGFGRPALFFVLPVGVIGAIQFFFFHGLNHAGLDYKGGGLIFQAILLIFYYSLG